MFVQNSAPGKRRQTSIMKLTVSRRSFGTFPGKGKDDVERRSDVRRQASGGTLVDLIEVLKGLIHQLQDLGRARIDALAYLMKTGALEQLQIFSERAGRPGWLWPGYST